MVKDTHKHRHCKLVWSILSRVSHSVLVRDEGVHPSQHQTPTKIIPKAPDADTCMLHIEKIFRYKQNCAG